MPADDAKYPQRSGRRAVDSFLREAASLPSVQSSGTRGKLVFAMDATASREPSWERACRIQAQMFEQTAALGGLDIQLCFYRGRGELKASRWLSDAEALHKAMSAVTCLGGRTQIERVLRHAANETGRAQVNALVFVGDAMEEDIDRVCAAAGELGLRGVPAFVFHEGTNPMARRALQQIAKLSGGAYCAFDTASAQQLRELLGAVAVYAAGGQPALAHYSRQKGGLAKQLTQQLGEDQGRGS